MQYFNTMVPTPDNPAPVEENEPMFAAADAEDEALESISHQFLRAVLNQENQRDQEVYERKKIETLKSLIKGAVQDVVQEGYSSCSPEMQRRIWEAALKETREDLAVQR